LPVYQFGLLPDMNPAFILVYEMGFQNHENTL
jgi:hypothetical protein